jgi:acetoacetyl-CoA synthetase
VEAIPYTISGKKVELAVAKILRGEAVTNRDALANPESLDRFRELARQFGPGAPVSAR